MSKSPYSLFRSMLLATTLVSMASPAMADFPDRPIRYVVGAGPGSSGDMAMRIVLNDAGDRLGTTFVVENRTGASGLIAMQNVVSSRPDGYTLGHGNIPVLAINPGMSKVSADTADSLIPIVQVGYLTSLLSVRPTLPVNSISELIAYAKAHPGKLVYGSAGNGSSGHVGMELFKKMTGVEIVHVPYKSAPAALNDLAAGHIDLTLDNVASSLTFFHSGKIKTLGISSLKRSALLPEIPTISESGVDGFEVTQFSGIVGPKGIAPDVIQKINAAINSSLLDPKVIAGLRELGYEIAGGSPENFGATVAKERKKWGAVIRDTGARID